MRYLLAALLMTLAGCDNVPSSDSQQAVQQEQAAVQSNQQVGFPGVTNFTEKRLMRQLYELRDREIATFAYVPDMQGRLWHLCDSIGYGLPYGTQFTNPEKIVRDTNGFGTLNQPEPNGLFMPPTAEGTWVVCGTKDDLKPVYVEPRVIISPFRLNSVGDWQGH